MTSKKSVIVNLVSAVVVVLIIALLAGFVWKFTNGGSEDFKTFYLERDGTKLLASHSNMNVECGKEYRFDVKYLFSGDSKPREYHAEVVPNPDVDFKYVVDKKVLTWQDTDISGVFALKKDATFFTVVIPPELTLITLFEMLYPQSEVSFNSSEIPSQKLYSIVVTSDNENTKYRIDFDTKEGSYVQIKDLALDKDALAF